MIVLRILLFPVTVMNVWNGDLWNWLGSAWILTWLSTNLNWLSTNLIWQWVNLIWHSVFLTWQHINLNWHNTNWIWCHANLIWQSMNLNWQNANLIWQWANLTWKWCRQAEFNTLDAFAYLCWCVWQSWTCLTSMCLLAPNPNPRKKEKNVTTTRLAERAIANADRRIRTWPSPSVMNTFLLVRVVCGDTIILWPLWLVIWHFNNNYTSLKDKYLQDSYAVPVEFLHCSSRLRTSNVITSGDCLSTTFLPLLQKTRVNLWLKALQTFLWRCLR